MEKDNEIAQALYAGESSPKLDAAVKRIFSAKPILARILKAFVYEFSAFEIEEIEQNIEETSEISSIPVMPDQRLKESGRGTVIEGRNTEDVSVNEGSVRYDLLFNAYVPDSCETIKLIINVEGQASDYTEYPLVSRAFYYGSRLISGQNGREFSSSHYGDIKKVISIWIVYDVSKEKAGTVNRYYIQEDHIAGHTVEPKENYDLMEVIMVYVGEGNNGRENIIRMLEVLVSPEIAVKDKMYILEEDYGISMHYDDEEEVNSMCNISEYVFDRGIRKGKQEGIETANLSNIRMLITKKNWSAEDAMDLFEIDKKEEREKYLQILKEEGLILS